MFFSGDWERLQKVKQEEAVRNIRQYRANDEAAVVGVWYRAGIAAYPYLPTWQAFPLEQAGVVFQEVILAECMIWVGTLNECVVSFLAMKGSYIDRLYVDPSEWRKGWGTELVDLAKSISPNGLSLHTHVENHAARAFYERHHFRVVRFGTSPPPESAPDVEYCWGHGDLEAPGLPSGQTR